MKHNPAKAVRSLSQKNDCRIYGNKIYILSDKVWHSEKKKKILNPLKRCDLGNKSWGKIDFLVKYADYKVIVVNDFDKQTMKNASEYDDSLACRYLALTS